jgi:hypothetical protein
MSHYTNWRGYLEFEDEKSLKQAVSKIEKWNESKDKLKYRVENGLSVVITPVLSLFSDDSNIVPCEDHESLIRNLITLTNNHLLIGTSEDAEFEGYLYYNRKSFVIDLADWGESKDFENLNLSKYALDDPNYASTEIAIKKAWYSEKVTKILSYAGINVLKDFKSNGKNSWINSLEK